MLAAGIIHEGERIELMEGEIVLLPGRGLVHERIRSALTIAVIRTLPDYLTTGAATTLRLTDTTMLEPDIAVFPRDLFKKSVSGFAALDPGEAELAASSLAYDKGLKARLYARHRVKELWVIDANERIAFVHTGPSGDGWSSIITRGPNETLTTPALPSFAIRLDEID